jgi:hypothetical protein
MAFHLEYIPLITEQNKVSKSSIEPRNIYKINSYKYKEGVTKPLSGIDTALVFVIGITPDKTVCCLKISEVKSKIFFTWLSKLAKKGLSSEEIDESEQLSDLLMVDNRDGKKIFNQFVKSSRIYRADPFPYRTYILGSIKNVEEIKINKDLLKKYLGSK